MKHLAKPLPNLKGYTWTYCGKVVHAKEAGDDRTQTDCRECCTVYDTLWPPKNE